MVLAHGTTDVAKYTKQILEWWQTNYKEIPAWAEAARVVFAFAPSSCSTERVFSMLKTMYGDDQDSALADYIQAGLMLRYNKRCVG